MSLDGKKEIELIMFDLDGTLADTGRDLATAVNYARSHFKLPPLEERFVCGLIGGGVEHLLRNSLPGGAEERFREAMTVFLEYYERHLLDTTVLYPGVAETLNHFRKKRMAVVSNKPHSLTVSVLRGLGIHTFFDAILGGDSVRVKKPDPEPIRQVLARCRVSPLRAVMVGDMHSDIDAGRRAGVYTCGVTYGLGKIEDLLEAGPDIIVDHIGKLVEHFR